MNTLVKIFVSFTILDVSQVHLGDTNEELYMSTVQSLSLNMRFARLGFLFRV